MKRLSCMIIFLILLSACQKNASDRAGTSTVVPRNSNTPVKITAYPDTLDKNQTVKIYGFKSGRFAFDLSGPGIQSGTLSVFIDDYGHFESKRSNKVLSNGNVVNNWTIKHGRELFGIKPEDKRVISTIMRERTSAAIDMDRLIAEHGSLEDALHVLAEQKIRLLPDETIHGYSCQVYEQEQNEITVKRWVYKGIELRMSIRKGNEESIVTRDLIKAEFDVEIPGEYFEYPSNFEIIQSH